jgi:hypothetical protein
MRNAAKAFAAILMGSLSLSAHAGTCDAVNGATKVAAAGIAGAATQMGLAAAPVTAVAHSSGALILTGGGGYLANTLGPVAAAWAIATAPVTVAIVGAVGAAGVATAVTCHYLASKPTPARPKRAH